MSSLYITMATLVRARLFSLTGKHLTRTVTCRTCRFNSLAPRCSVSSQKGVNYSSYLQKRSFRCSVKCQSEGKVINMPALSPTMEEGIIVKWFKKEGDAVEAGEVLCEIQTDKAVVSFDYDDDAVFAKIIVAENSGNVKLGEPICVLVEVGEDWKNVQMPSAAATAPAAPTPAVAPLPAASGGSVDGIVIKMPAMSPTMEEGELIRWLKQPGDKISAGDIVAEIQTDKAVLTFDYDEEAIFAKALVPDNTKNIKLGTPICILVEEGEDWKDVKIPGAEPAASAAAPAPAAAHDETQPHLVGLATRLLLDKYGITDLNRVKATGPLNNLLKEDVMNYININRLTPVPITVEAPPAPAKKPAAAAPKPVASDAPYIDIELTGMRKAIAKRLTQSKTQVPHSYGTIDSKIDSLLALRKELKSHGINTSVNDYIIKAVALALQFVPRMHMVWEGDNLVRATSADVSVAVATPTGLITPIITDVMSRDVGNISATVKEMAGRAKEGRLKMNEISGGSFTISNLGMFGITEFSAIINQPQCGILAIGGGRPELDEQGNVVTKMMSTLSYDANAIPEEVAAEFMETLQYVLETPSMLVTKLNSRMRSELEI